jgi:hypothetical protein
MARYLSLPVCQGEAVGEVRRELERFPLQSQTRQGKNMMQWRICFASAPHERKQGLGSAMRRGKWRPRSLGEGLLPRKAANLF